MNFELSRRSVAMLGCALAVALPSAVAGADPIDPHQPDITKGYFPSGRWGFGQLAVCDVAAARVARHLSQEWSDRLVERLQQALLGSSLGPTDVVSFTAGIGENDAAVRWDALAGLGELGIEVDQERNASGSGQRRISSDESRIAVLVEATNEELAIAQACVRVLSR